ncbi:hypothetical protein [Pseudomonas sp. SWI44]|uniref:hypothetical protein n=1 Tax=Pseudomonas sp. SWI44 TaxID=2083053 RepID=UPI001319D178|nr:hypothetical protein [Pseudomonas sp. SWI44]
MMKLLRNDAQAGDIFYIPAITPAGEVGFVLARFIEHVEHNAGALIEVFKKFYREPPKTLGQVDMTGRLFRPILCSMRFSEIPRWRILFRGEAYDRLVSNYRDITLEYHSDFRVGGVRHPKPVSEHGYASCSPYEAATCWRMHHIVFRVNAHLAGYFGPNDSCRMSEIPEDMRIGNEVAEQKVLGLAKEVDGLFKKWAKK